MGNQSPIRLQAVASMLMGVKPDEMMETEDLVAWNSEQADEPRYKWYPVC